MEPWGTQQGPLVPVTGLRVAKKFRAVSRTSVDVTFSVFNLINSSAAIFHIVSQRNVRRDYGHPAASRCTAWTEVQLLGRSPGKGDRRETTRLRKAYCRRPSSAPASPKRLLRSRPMHNARQKKYADAHVGGDYHYVAAGSGADIAGESQPRVQPASRR
jgi:hypothetical protein